MEVYVTPKHDSKVATRDEFIDLLTRTWISITCRNDARYMWLEVTRSPPPGTVLKSPSHKLFLNGLSLGTFVSPGSYHSHWKSAFCTTAEILTNATQDANSDTDDEEDCSSNQLSALFEHDTESLSVVWKQSPSLHWRMEIAFDSLADRVLVVSKQGRTVHLFLFLANQPKIYRGRCGEPQSRAQLQFHRHLLSSEGASRVMWERECCFESCDRRTFGACNVLHMKLTTLTQDLNTLVCRLEIMDFAVYYSNPVLTEMENTNYELPWPTFQTFDASYAWFCLQTRGFKVLDQARSGEFTELLNTATTNPQFDRILNAVAVRVDEWLICDLRKTLVEELELLEKTGRTSEDAILRPDGDHFVSIRRLLITPTTMRGLSAQWGVGNRVVRHYDSDRFIRVIIRDEDLSLLSGANRLRKPIGAITDFLRRDLVVADRRYHFLGCSNSQLREHGLWMYAGDGQEGHTVDAIRRWMGDLSKERCIATYVSRLGQFFSASRNTIEVAHVEMIPDVQNDRYCFTDGIGKISPLLAKTVTTIRNSLIHANRRVAKGGHGRMSHLVG